MVHAVLARSRDTGYSAFGPGLGQPVRRPGCSVVLLRLAAVSATGEYKRIRNHAWDAPIGNKLHGPSQFLASKHVAPRQGLCHDWRATRLWYASSEDAGAFSVLSKPLRSGITPEG